MTAFFEQPTLPTVWFIFIAIFWIGYLILDGFDLGVGMMMSKIFAKNEKERRLLLNTIGPVWDGNEVWLVTAGAATFAAFPHWYASLLSALYIPLVLLLVALILRVVAIDYRGKKASETWVTWWNRGIVVSSAAIAFFIGALLALTTTGLPVNESGNVVSAFAWLASPFTYIGGVGMVLFSLVQGMAFVALKTDGEVRHRARARLAALLPVAVLPLLAWALYLQFVGKSAGALSWALLVLALLAVVFAWVSVRADREGRAFVGTSLFMGAGALAIFSALFPNVFTSTLDPDFSLTVANAASSDYTLTIMTWLGVFALPLIILYQSWSYYQFRQRIRVEHIPAVHEIKELPRGR
ncbi:cytochrome d ubiquinol oxidase subunit II [Rothia aerolata]|uniref:Cytochrome c oxidase assembly protein n=1 Tax=Rothia aerolata TaxID=1812262 RepID=A0A917IL01_9MICC|nr:cytochrome d ubiquinol oxidase subunit II [Rothia aerolata]GGH56681.1 cytochrome c oxidase assembly protein [Rothia aerolata]